MLESLRWDRGSMKRQAIAKHPTYTTELFDSKANEETYRPIVIDTDQQQLGFVCEYD